MVIFTRNLYQTKAYDQEESISQPPSNSHLPPEIINFTLNPINREPASCVPSDWFGGNSSISTRNLAIFIPQVTGSTHSLCPTCLTSPSDSPALSQSKLACRRRAVPCEPPSGGTLRVPASGTLLSHRLWTVTRHCSFSDCQSTCSCKKCSVFT